MNRIKEQHERDEKNTSKDGKDPEEDRIAYEDESFIDDPTIDFSKLENFLHPKSGSLRRLIEERVLKHPKILSEMLSVNFSDLVSVFQDLFNQHKNKKTKKLDDIYIELLDIVEGEGSEGIQKYAASLKNKKFR